jgi:hypothetical protein
MASARNSLFLLAVLISSAFLVPVRAGPAAAMTTYGICQTGCNTAWVACVGAAGFIAGTFTLGLGVPAAAAACSAQQGICMAACATMAGIAAVSPTI